MKTLKNTLTSLLLLTATTSILSATTTFEQTGVKEGNTRLAVGVYSTVPDGGDASVTVNGELGHFLTDDIEIALATFITSSNGDTFYYIKPGANYYFLKTPTLTPYVGGHLYYFDSTADGAEGSFGNNYHVGAHMFFSENVAVTGELGLDFFEFSDYLQTYTNVSLTYFFD
jgi:hypothetical protein